MSAEKPDITIVGMPESGKTTLLAAIWHTVREPGSTSALVFDGLKQGNYEHLNAITKRWRAGKKQQRTQTAGMKVVSMRLRSALGTVSEISFPDIPGEDFSGMWEKREIEEDLVSTLAARSIVLVVNGDTIRFPAWIVEEAAIAKGAGLDEGKAAETDWNAKLAPTQVQLVEILQFLMAEGLRVGDRRLAILITAWDQVEGEGLEPAEILELKLPLLHQYLQSNRDPWVWRVWGVSAQGGMYEDPDKNEQLAETEALRELGRASDRIKVVDGKSATTDITLPLEWLIG